MATSITDKKVTFDDSTSLISNGGGELYLNSIADDNKLVSANHNHDNVYIKYELTGNSYTYTG